MADLQPYRAVILDAGSTGTRAYIYNILPASTVAVRGLLFQQAKVTELFTNTGMEMRNTNRGIHTVGEVDDVYQQLQVPDHIATQLDPTFDDVIASLGGNVLLTDWCFLLATAGMRGLGAAAEGLGRHDAIHAALKAYMITKGFNENKVVCRTIFGTEEARFGWVAANYTQGNPAPYEKGYVEMGGASMQIAFLLPVNAGAELENVQAAFGQLEGNGLNTMQVVNVGERQLFLASCQLGTSEGYQAYKRAMHTSDNQIIRPVGGPQIVRDPIKIPGYNQPDVDHAGCTIQDVPGVNPRLGDHGRRDLWLPLITTAIQGQLPGADERTLERICFNLRQLHKGYQFLGASNFWYSMKGVPDGPDNFDFGSWMNGLNDIAGDPNEEIKRGLPGFKGLWLMYVGWNVFGLGWGRGQAMTFVPYSGAGGKERLSWTLGAAVLLAARDLQHLCTHLGPCFGQ